MLNWLGSLKCPDCGGRITEQEKYCPHCGTDLDAPVQRSHEEAMEYFERAQKTYDRNGSMVEALLDCELALQYNPEFAEAHNLHGLILDALEKPQKAIKAYRRALELDPNLEDARANIMDFEAEHRTFESHQSPPELNPHPDEIKSGMLDAETGLDHESAIYASKQARENSKARKQQTKRFILAAVATPVILFSIACTFWFVSNFIGTYFGPKSTVVFEADHSLVTSVKRADLEATAAILTERCQELGYKNISFHVSDQNEIIGEVPNFLNPQKVADKIGTLGLLEFVDFGSQTYPEGQAIRTDRNDEYFQNLLQGSVFHTVMDNDGIGTAAVVENQLGGYEISFTLTSEATQIFADYTATHRGEYLGILLDGVVVSVPMINEPITGGEGSISGQFTEEEAKNLAAILRTKPLPIPIRIKQISNN
jgi:tetratricopeptide (TPR) repeat protein